MNTNHFEGFKAFAAAQAPDKAIDHRNGYSHCAIGEYGNSVGLNGGGWNDEEIQPIIKDVAAALVEQTGITRIRMVIDAPYLAKKIIPTYGDLVVFLNNPGSDSVKEHMTQYGVSLD